MTWTININGHDDLTGDEKVDYEEALVEKARSVVRELAAAEGSRVSSASATTNTTGTVNLLA
jgi:hypothetical protein